eukprot:TRINITY_DN25321_c0_g1_i1.p1 TRINITY_DN25321_c0_g1~~TRINITY_DN25321_c0_g1_i1.p1  ORF type:complete len:379 (+),score=73.34 TRINITY_DN25321_c0_g1_i1:856-1992(+)
MRAAFTDLLLRSYSNLVRAWRLGLDRDRNGRMDIREFKRAVKDVGFAGNPQELWQELDLNGNGYVSLFELDPMTYEVLQDFLEHAKLMCGSWWSAWRQVMDTRSNDRITFLDFKQGCQLMGYSGDVGGLFELLDIDQLKYLSWDTVAWISNGLLSEEDDVEPEAGTNAQFPGSYTQLTRMQRRRADINARNNRARAKQFEARARGELPGSSPAAGTSMFAPGKLLNSHLHSKTQSLPSLTKPSKQLFTQTQTMAENAWSAKVLGRPASHGGEASQTDDERKVRKDASAHNNQLLPQWLRVAEGLEAMPPPPPPKEDLSFPLRPQAPGKGGWPCLSINLVDKSWGGGRDIGQRLSPMSRRACTDFNLARWRAQALAAET